MTRKRKMWRGWAARAPDGLFYDEHGDGYENPLDALTWGSESSAVFAPGDTKVPVEIRILEPKRKAKP